MNETHRFLVSISCWRLETISINVHKTPVEYFEYTAAPRAYERGTRSTLYPGPRKFKYVWSVFL